MSEPTLPGIGRAFPRFECPGCGRSVASPFRDAIHSNVGNKFLYAYLRRHVTPAGEQCPVEHTGPLATPIGGRRG
jgi:hypothetical protein